MAYLRKSHSWFPYGVNIEHVKDYTGSTLDLLWSQAEPNIKIFYAQ